MKKKLLFSFLMGLLLAFPLSTQAKGTLTKVETIEYIEGKEEPTVEFESLIQEKGRKYKLIETKETIQEKVPKIEIETITEEQKVYGNQDFVPEKEIQKNGKTYTLSGSQFKVDALTKEVSFRSREEVDPTTKQVVGTKVIELSLKNIREEIDEVPLLHNIGITVYNLEAEEFVIAGEVEVIKGDILRSLEPEILRRVGLEGEKYSLYALSWVGDAYLHHGEYVRNAFATIHEDLPKFVGEYETEVKTYELSYETEKQVETKIKKEVVATYELISSPLDFFTSIWGVFLLVLVVGIVTLLFVLSKKKKKEKEN